MDGQGGRGGHKLAACCSWDIFEESAKDNESHGRLGSSKNPLSPTAGRLCKEDMAIYGEEPAMDRLSLVVCKQCDRVVKSQAYQKHKRLYHSAEMLKIPAPKRLAHPPHHPTPTPIHTVGQPTNAVTVGEMHGGEPVMGFTATSLPTVSGGDQDGGGERREGGKSSKGYDPNRHCGVWLDNEQKPCTRSLTCKFHSLSLRRKVAGRSRPFDELLDLHKKRKKWKKQGRQNSEAGLPPPQQPSPLQSPILPSSHVPHQPLPAASPLPGPSTSTASPLAAQWDQGELGDTEGDLLCTSFPRPLAVCSFGTRSTGLGSTVFSRRQDSLRSGLAHLAGRTSDYTITTLHSSYVSLSSQTIISDFFGGKHSYHSLLKQRNTQRKYFKKPSDLERPTAFGSTSTPHEPPTLPPTLWSQPPTSIPSPTTVPKPPELQSLFSASQFYLNAGSPPPSPSGPTATHNWRDSVEATSSPPATQGTEKPKKTTKKSKSRRGRRAKHHPSSEKDRNNRTVSPQGNQSSDMTTVTTSTSSTGLTPDTPVLETSQMGFSNLEFTMNSTATSTVPLSVARRASNGSDNVTVANIGGGVVTIKQEPFTNHEEEMEAQSDANYPKSKSAILNGMVNPNCHTGLTPTIHSFNSVNSPQTFVINPTVQHPSSAHPMMTSLSPHMSGIIPIGGPLGNIPQNPTLSPSHQQQLQQSFTFGQSLQPNPTSLHLSGVRVHMLPSQTHRTSPNQMYLAGNSAAASNSFLPHQLTPPSPSLSPLAVRTNVSPSLHSSTIPSAMRTHSQVPVPVQSPGKFQLAVSGSTKHRTSKVRAPISQIPTSSHLQDSHSRTVPPSGITNVVNQSSFQSKQNLTPRTHPPSQQVT